jgi:hypothetical protein
MYLPVEMAQLLATPSMRTLKKALVSEPLEEDPPEPDEPELEPVEGRVVNLG